MRCAETNSSSRVDLMPCERQAGRKEPTRNDSARSSHLPIQCKAAARLLFDQQTAVGCIRAVVDLNSQGGVQVLQRLWSRWAGVQGDNERNLTGTARCEVIGQECGTSQCPLLAFVHKATGLKMH
eukprot:1161964-Pelagomonas_calceolata.AAC.2